MYVHLVGQVSMGRIGMSGGGGIHCFCSHLGIQVIVIDALLSHQMPHDTVI